jgi:hypothetical protein
MPQGMGLAQPRRHDKISAPTFFPIRDLSSENRTQARIGHSGPPHDPLPLQPSRRRNDDHPIAEAFGVRFEQQRNIEYDHRIASAARCRNELLLGGPDNRVKYPFQPP